MDDPTQPAEAGPDEQDDMQPESQDSHLEPQDADADAGAGEGDAPGLGGNPGGLGVPPPPG